MDKMDEFCHSPAANRSRKLGTIFVLCMTKLTDFWFIEVHYFTLIPRSWTLRFQNAREFRQSRPEYCHVVLSGNRVVLPTQRRPRANRPS
jgi:hypothetical protein